MDELGYQRASIDHQEVMLACLCSRFMPDQDSNGGGGCGVWFAIGSFFFSLPFVLCCSLFLFHIFCSILIVLSPFAFYALFLCFLFLCEDGFPICFVALHLPDCFPCMFFVLFVCFSFSVTLTLRPR